jgi:hypothetical protein
LIEDNIVQKIIAATSLEVLFNGQHKQRII